MVASTTDLPKIVMTEQSQNHERLPLVARELELDENFQKLGQVASSYGYSLHTAPSYALLTRTEISKISEAANPEVLEAIGIFATKLSDDPIEMRVKDLHLWTQKQRRRVALSLYHTTQTLQERRDLIKLIQKKSDGIDIPDELIEANPQIGVAISKKRIIHDREIVSRHLLSVMPHTVTVSRVGIY